MNVVGKIFREGGGRGGPLYPSERSSGIELYYIRLQLFLGVQPLFGEPGLREPHHSQDEH